MKSLERSHHVLIAMHLQMDLSKYYSTLVLETWEMGLYESNPGAKDVEMNPEKRLLHNDNGTGEIVSRRKTSISKRSQT